jgi:ribonuclease P/MRP protein subunit RPP40
VIFINDLPENIATHIKLYADDSKIIGIIESEEDAKELQKDIDAAVNWSHKWFMPFNIEKCKVMHVGRANMKSNRIYQMKNTEGSLHDLAETILERDLGVLTSCDLKLKAQVEAAASMANRALGRLKKSFRSRSLLLWRTLYLAYIRPHLEFAFQAWSPHFKGDIETLEKIQRRATKTITALKRLKWEERLARLGLTLLEDRRVRGDLIEQYKIMHNFENVRFFVPQQPPDWATNSTYGLRRGHDLLLKAQQVTAGEERSHFFTNRVAAPWNALSYEAVHARSVNAFKDHIGATAA